MRKNRAEYDFQALLLQLQGSCVLNVKLRCKGYCSYGFESFDHQCRCLTSEYVEKRPCNPISSLLSGCSEGSSKSDFIGLVLVL